MSGITTLGTRAFSWVRNNVSGAAAEPGDFTPQGRPAEEIDHDYAGVQDRLGKVKGDLDRLDEDTKLRPPSLKNFKDMELIMLGGATGAIIGGGLGLADSLIGSAAAKPEVVVTETKVPIYEHKFVGSTTQEVPRYDHQPIYNDRGQVIGQTNDLTGWDIKHVAQFEDKQIGEYTQRSHEVRGPGGGSPLTSGLVGMGIGLGAGAVLGAAVAFGRKAVGQGYEEQPRRPIQGETQIIVKSGIVGAALGAGIGFINGAMEANNAVHQTYSSETPVLEHRTAQMPADWFKSALSPSQGNTPGNQTVNYDTPKTGFFGRPSVDDHKVEVNADSRFGVLGGVLGGAVVGGVAGVGVGVAINILRRTI